MIIKARFYRNDHYSLVGFLSCLDWLEPKRVRFIIDTGCTVTTIFPIEAKRLGIRIKDFPMTGYAETASDTVPVHCLRNATISFEVQENADSSLEPINFIFPELDIINPKKNILYRFFSWLNELLFSNVTDYEKVPYTHNLLGMDFLIRFKYWIFTNNELIMSTEHLENLKLTE